MDFASLIENEYVRSLLILIGFILVANVIHFVINNYVKKLTANTKTDLDDLILKAIIGPMYFFMFFLGLYLALKPLSFIAPYENYLDGAYFVIAVLTLAFIIGDILGILLNKSFHLQKKQKAPQIITKVAIVVIYLIAFLIILSHFKIEITPFIAAMGVGGLAVGLALQNTLSNLFSGIHILSDKPVRVGDFIELDGNISGFVEDIGWRSTRIRTLPDNIVVVPNSKLADSIIINDSLPGHEMALVVKCGVSYDSDLDKVEKVTIDVAKHIQKTVPGAVKDFEPFVRYTNFGDSNIDFSIILRISAVTERGLVLHEFIKALKKAYDKNNIEISWPVRKIYQGK